MVHLTNLAIASALGSAASVFAAPATINERTTCTFTTAAAVKAGKASCSTIILDGITVAAGTTLDLTDLTKGTTVTFEGTTSFGYEQWDGPLISISGTSITVNGASGHVINGNGADWWDGEGSNGGKTKPKFFSANALDSSTIKGLNIKNTPVQTFSINDCNGLIVSGVTIDNSAGASKGHNTDAFDIAASTGVHIDSATVYNQDDCLAINSGTDIAFTNSYCSGGHGISIGSVGGRTDNIVENVYIYNNKIVDSMNGVRIKTVYDATGTVKNVTYKDITLSGITEYGIVIEQDYENGSPTGTPTTGVPITELYVESVTGSIESTATDVYILCGSSTSCASWSFSGNTFSGGKSSTACKNIPANSGAKC